MPSCVPSFELFIDFHCDPAIATCSLVSFLMMTSFISATPVLIEGTPSWSRLMISLSKRRRVDVFPERGGPKKRNFRYRKVRHRPFLSASS